MSLLEILEPGTWEHSAYNETASLLESAVVQQLALPFDGAPDFLTELRGVMDWTIDLNKDSVDVTPQINVLFSLAANELSDRYKLDFTNMEHAAWEVYSLVISKQHDYGHHNILRFGLVGILIRMHDKVARLENLLDKNVLGGGKVPTQESIKDTLMDIMGYSIIALMLIHGKFEHTLKIDPNVLRYHVDLMN